VQVPSAKTFQRYFRGEQLRQLDWMAYSGSFNSQSLDAISLAAERNRKVWSKGLAYYMASLYLQLGEPEKSTELLRNTGRPSREMKWFCVLLLHCRANGVSLPKLTASEERSLDYIQERYCDLEFQTYRSGEHSQLQVENCSRSLLAGLFAEKSNFAVIGNAPSSSSTDNFSLSDSYVSTFFNNYSLNPRVQGDPDIHVVTPAWQPVNGVEGMRLVITGNSIFHRRSKVWQRFANRPLYAGIHTLPREHWGSLVTKLNASPSAGLMWLSFIDRYCDVKGKHGLVAGFSEGAPTLNHSYDREPASPRHNWPAEGVLRKEILHRIGRQSDTFMVSA